MYVYWWYLHLLDVQESMWTVTVGADASVPCACPRAALWCDAGSMDRTVKLWDLNAGMQIATSRFQPCGVRALALDQDMLVCSASKACTVLLLISLCHESVMFIHQQRPSVCTFFACIMHILPLIVHKLTPWHNVGVMHAPDGFWCTCLLLHS